MTTSTHPTPATGTIHRVDSLGRPLRPVQDLDTMVARVSPHLTGLLLPWFQALRDRSNIDADQIPTDYEIITWTAGLFTDRGQGGRLRVRANPPKGASNDVLAVHALYRWHRSGGNLDGLFYARWVGGEAYDRVETYITVLQVASGYSSPAVAAWQSTGLFPAATEEVPSA